jgi:superfamily I DNA and/or RNA helicase
MNVGMTRARRKLLLVGDSSTLCRHPFFGELLAYVKVVGGYRTVCEMGRTFNGKSLYEIYDDTHSGQE